MKILGLSFGRKMENTEIIIKHALMAAKEQGADVGFIRMEDLDIRNCTGCIACVHGLARGGNGFCVIKDDLRFVEEQIFEADAVIYGAPVYVLTPSGLFKTVCDRYGPAHDIVFKIEENKKRIAAGKSGKDLIDERVFKPRYAAMVTVGGAATENWLSLGMPMMNMFAMSQGLQVVDQMQVYSMSTYGSVLSHQEFMDRAKQMGEHVYNCVKEGKAEWKGDGHSLCPVCHTDILQAPTGRNPVECPICGTFGTLRVEDGNIIVDYTEKELERSRMRYGGKLEHYVELMERPKELIDKIESQADDVKRKKEAYKGCFEIKKEN